jgi:hypothetical protein
VRVEPVIRTRRPVGGNGVVPKMAGCCAEEMRWELEARAAARCVANAWEILIRERDCRAHCCGVVVWCVRPNRFVALV